MFCLKKKSMALSACNLFHLVASSYARDSDFDMPID